MTGSVRTIFDSSSSASHVSFRSLVDADLALLVVWFAQPAIAHWWNEPATLESVTAKYGPRLGGNAATRMWIVEFDGAAAGMLQSYRHADYPDHDTTVGIPNAIGIDYLLGDDHRGRGLAPVVLRAFASWALGLHPECDCCVATPAIANEPSWRALERAGFRRRSECQPPDEPPAYAYEIGRESLTM